MRIKIVLAGGLLLIAVAVLAVLLHSPETVAATNAVPLQGMLGAATQTSSTCQPDETLPQGTTSIRMSFEAATGPPLRLSAIAQGRVLASGSVGSGWYGSEVTVPVKPLSQTFTHVQICTRFGPLTSFLALYGGPSPASAVTKLNGKGLTGRMRISYLRPDERSWLSLAGGVVKHMALGRAASGTWIVLPIAALIAAAIALASLALARELR